MAIQGGVAAKEGRWRWFISGKCRTGGRAAVEEDRPGGVMV